MKPNKEDIEKTLQELGKLEGMLKNLDIKERDLDKVFKTLYNLYNEKDSN